MTIAVITPKGKNTHDAINTSKDVLKREAQRRDLEVQITSDDKSVYVSIGFPMKEIRKTLDHAGIAYTIEEREGDKIIVAGNKVPGDYGLIKGQVKALTAERDDLILRIGKLEQTLAEETQSRMSIRADLDVARAKYKEILEAKDFVGMNMLRANSFWNTFVNLYADTLVHASKIYDIPQDILEREVLTFSSLQEREDFKAIARDLEDAKAAKEAAGKIRLIRMDPYVQQVLDKAAKIEKRQDKISEVRTELAAHIGKEKQWLVLTSKDKETLLNLPFTYNPSGKYHDLEKPLIEAINQSLTDSHLEYTQKEVNGLLGYVIHGMKTRAMTRLDKAISLTEDPFVKLCGERQVIQIIG